MPGFDQTTQPPGVGRTLAGRYRLIAPIARGGMAEVWEGHDEVLSRPVAVKVLQAHLAADGVFRERFRREAVTAARLAHPGIVATFDTGLDDGTAFIVMELVRGRNLRQWLNDYGRLDPATSVAVTRQVADALAYAHQAGLVHRDVKPANVLLVEDEWGGLRVKVTDFGIAKAGLGTGSDLTRTGMVLGTPKYLSPEQIKGSDPDARADLYSLGVVLYEMLVGEPPYVRETEMATALAHLSDRVPKPSSSVRGLPHALDRIVVDLLAKTADRRIQSAVELRHRLDGLGPLTAGSETRRRPVRRRDPGESGPGFEGWSAVPSGGAGGSGGPFPAPIESPTVAAPAVDATTLSSVDHTLAEPAAGGDAPTVVTPGFSAGPPPPPPALQATPATRAPAGGAPGGPRSGPPTPLSQAFPAAAGPRTDEIGALPPVRRNHHTERRVGAVVLGLVVIGALVAALLITSSNDGSGHGGSSPGVSAPAGPAKHIAAVSVYLSVTGHSLDNANLTSRAFDGNPATFWQTAVYTSPRFGNLYPGIGLAIDVGSSTALHTLTVTSPTVGWSASTYVAASAVGVGQPLSDWGTATDTKSGISGKATFNLAGHHGRYVLLWITDLGSADTAKIAELSVS